MATSYGCPPAAPVIPSASGEYDRPRAYGASGARTGPRDAARMVVGRSDAGQSEAFGERPICTAVAVDG